MSISQIKKKKRFAIGYVSTRPCTAQFAFRQKKEQSESDLWRSLPRVFPLVCSAAKRSINSAVASMRSSSSTSILNWKLNNCVLLLSMNRAKNGKMEIYIFKLQLQALLEIMNIMCVYGFMTDWRLHHTNNWLRVN